ncbi:MAG TPA: acyl-CoA dehydrogenase, partial [Nakamurella sp.]
DVWGVFAAEGPGVRVEASPAAGRWVLHGTKPWCSLADRLDRALITAQLPAGGRGLFAIDLTDSRVTVDPATDWVARGLVELPSVPIHLDDCPAEPVGPAGWYLNRAGFAWGGMGVAACWLGGAIGVGRVLHASTRSREPDQIALMHLGAVDAALTGAAHLVVAAADAVDGGYACGAAGVLWAARVRAVVASAVDTVLLRVGHALGPGPLVADPDHARRVADLQLYVRQHHAERDEAALGALVRDHLAWP